MSLDQQDNLAETPDELAVAEARPRRRRLLPRIWPFYTGTSVDTFATPSEPATGEIDPQSLLGPEPAVFGGINPPLQSEAASAASAGEGAEVTEPLGTTLDESVRGNELLADVPRIDIKRILRSTPFLLCAMIACLVGSTLFIRMAVPTETYVQTSVSFANYEKLNEQEIEELQIEISRLLRTYPLRQQAWDLLQKRSPDVPPGFLASGLTFHRLNAISWLPDGTIRLRVDSQDPTTDITRLSAVTDAFYKELEARTVKLEEYKASLAEQQKMLQENLQRDEFLKAQIDALLPDAQRYMDLKQDMQALERYVELADESNPLRLVARHALSRIALQVADARELSLKRDDLITERVAVQSARQKIEEEIARLQRAIEVWVYPKPRSDKHLVIHDTRDRQKMIVRTTWISIIVAFAGIFALIHFFESRAAERQRRERREMLKRQAQAAGLESPQP